MVSYGALRGAGDTRWPLRVVVLMNWGVGVPLVRSLTIPAGLGVHGAWLGIGILLAGQGLLLFTRFRSGKWQAIRLVEKPTPEPW